MKLLEGRSRSTIVIVLGLLAMVPYFALGDQFAADLYWDVCIGAIILTALVVAIRKTQHRLAWVLILTGQLCFLAGDVTWMVLDRVFQSEAYPNLGDVFYVSGYVLIAIGFWKIWRAQRAFGNVGALVDGLIVAVAAGVLLWVFFIGPAVLDSESSLAARIVNTAYPAGDLLLIAMGAQMLVRLERTVLSWLLSLGLATLLIGDIWYAYLAAAGTYSSGHPVDFFWWSSYVMIAALVMHERVDELTRTNTSHETPQLSLTRVTLLAATTMAAPVTVVARSTAKLDPELTPLLGGTIALFLLVVFRLAIVAKQLESSRGRLEHEATHDVLTGLGNRALYSERVRQALLPSPTTPERTAVMCIDLDDFKTVNDSLGHAAGDRLLQEIGDRLRATVRRADAVARLGGDEFAVLVSGESAEAAIDVAERLLSEIRMPVELGPGTFAHPSASIGIAFGEPGASVDSLLRDADIAMYTAKDNGKGRWEVYRPGMRQRVLDRFELQSDLAEVLEGDQLFLHYQPIVDVSCGAVRAVEALVRWQHPTKGRIDPGRFIGLAEETGMIVPIGRWVLTEACRQAHLLDPSDDGPRIAVNVSAVQLRSDQLATDVSDALKSSGLAPHRLLLELTESAMIDDYATAAAKLTEVRALGVGIALDDFGAGYTSLRQLSSFPVDVVKLDPSFINGSVGDGAAVLDGLVSMANSLGLETVGEGIEETAQLDRLRQARCQLAQGYLFSRPVPFEDLAAALDGAQAMAIRQDVPVAGN